MTDGQSESLERRRRPEMNAARIIDIDQRRKDRGDARPTEIVAVVLADGSVRDLREGEIDRPAEDFESGQVSGDRWTLWWERRAW
jgi:hypothetical protein